MASLQHRHLVIFGCGYVGAALAAAARRAGARVSALTRNAARAAALRAEGVTVIEAELAAEDWHAALATDIDLAVNTVSAAEPTPAGYRRSYVDGTRSILAWAAGRSRPLETLVYTSSTGVYPQGGGAVVDETAAVGGASPTGDVLVEAEALLRTAPAAAVGRSFILRLAGIYGPGRHSLLDQVRAGVTVINGRGDHRLNVVHRDDVVTAILAGLTAPAGPGSDTFNVSDGAPAPKAEVVGWLAAQLGRPVPAFDATSPSIRRGGAGVPDRVIVSDRLRARLGWRPVFPTYREGYAALLRGEV
jgi:nucleoside-diphosphate-sugar epimerase